MRILLTWAVALLLVVSLPATASAAKHCRGVRGSDSWKGQRLTVAVQHGHVTCRKARRVARRFFSNRSHYHDHGTNANSYWTIPGGWRGNFNMGYWWATKGSKRVGGLMR